MGINTSLVTYTVAHEFNSALFPQKALDMMNDLETISPRERMMNIEAAISLEDPNLLLEIFICTTRFKIENLFDFSQISFNEFIQGMTAVFGSFGSSNYSKKTRATIPMTLVYLSLFYFMGIDLKKHIEDDYQYLYELLAVNTANYIEKYF